MQKHQAWPAVNNQRIMQPNYTSGFHPAFFIIGLFLTIVGLSMLIPAAIDAVTLNSDWHAFLKASGVSIFLGVLMICLFNKPFSALSIRQGYVLTIGAWIAISVVVALPYWFSEFPISFSDALFEAVSGLTTTGSTVFTGLDDMPLGIILWRALTQWIGGIGIIVMAVALLPFLRVGGMQLFRMESSDQSEKVMSSVARASARIIIIYTVFTVSCFVAFAVEGMTLFEAIVHAMTTISTGGFSSSDESIGHFHSATIDWTVIFFMILASLPFMLILKSCHFLSISVLLKDSQIRAFLIMLLVLVLIFSLWLIETKNLTTINALRISAFSIVSVISSTGFASGDYLTYGEFASLFFLIITFIGGCAGSTAGGFKIFRFQVMASFISTHIFHLSRPKSVQVAKLNGRPMEEDIFPSVSIFFFLGIFSFLVLSFALSLTGLDWLTSISASATALANVGPGIGDMIGPSGNFVELSSSAKWMLDAGMILGRLEYLAVFVFLVPDFWNSY